IHITSHATALAVCLSLAAAAAFAGEGAAAPAVPPAPAAPPAAVDSTAVPSPADADEAALQANMDAARTSEEAARASEKAAARSDAELQARMDAARHRLEVAAQQLAALSAQMSGPMMRFDAFGGQPRARVREVSPGGPAEQAGVRAGDLIVAVNGTDVRGQGSAGHVVELLHDVKPGDRVDLRVSRGGKTRDLRVTARPDGNAFFVGRQFPDLPPLALPQVRALAQ